MDRRQRLAENLKRVHARIETACRQSGRDPSEVRLVAVTKYVDSDTARDLAAAGCRDLGESRPPLLLQKSGDLADLQLDWHLIGHLQRNKIKQIAGCHPLIHSVDSERLLMALEEYASQHDLRFRCLLEVNISSEMQKHGFQREAVPAVLEKSRELQRVAIEGLMGMAGLELSARDTAGQFGSLRELRDRCRHLFAVPAASAGELSMGMSGDFELAIAEGATILRIGSILFDGVI